MPQPRGKTIHDRSDGFGAALQDALRELVEVHGLSYLDTFLERRLHSTELRGDNALKVPGILSAHRSTADDAEAALRREIETVRSSPKAVRKTDAFATS